MPTYEYVCDACKHEFEEFQSMTAKVLKKCPECGKSKLRRLIGTGAGVIFKGSGFYETDYRSDSYNTAAKAESGSKSETASKDSGTPSTPKTETTTPAPKSESKPASTAKPAKAAPSSKK